MNRSFRWGIIGPGRIAKKFADCIDLLPGSRIEAIASRSSKNLDLLRKELRAQLAFHSYEEMLEKSQLDAVYIATPHRYHYENTILVQQYNLPALVEKAFTIHAQEAEKLIQVAREKQLFLMEAMWTRFLPVYQQIRQWIEAEEIGEVRCAYSSLGFSAERNDHDRLLNIELAGGSTLDLGIYNVAASQLAFQRVPENLCAQGYIGKTGVDEAVSVSLDYGQGCLSQFTYTFLLSPPNQLEICGTKGFIRTQPSFVSSQSATLTASGSKREYEGKFDINGFEYEIREAQRCIQSGLIESPLMTHQETLDNMHILDSIRSMIGMKYPFE